MIDMFSPSAVKRDPPDIELVKEVTLQQFSNWLMRHFGALPQHLVEPIRDLTTLKRGLAPIYEELRDGDSLWLCRSRVIGPLHGHEGIALVRDKQPVIYIRIIQR
ncbi:hypothetical protein [Roseibium sp. LAB1]|tara:strand:+ start:149 stop:463 length:315 start_codon:yes stop_codon:yes gene_type:complete